MTPGPAPDRRTLFALVEVLDDVRVRVGDTLVDVSDGLRVALENAGLDVGRIDVRAIPTKGPATAFAAMADGVLIQIPEHDRVAAYAALAAVVHETRAEERRRLCLDPRALAAAQQLTRDEIARHGMARRSA